MKLDAFAGAIDRCGRISTALPWSQGNAIERGPLIAGVAQSWSAERRAVLSGGSS